jgi:hypothetical protein
MRRVYLSPESAALIDVLPTFALIGAMKAGTTSISSALDSHPDVFMCTPKEPQFFTTRWDRGLPWYESLFAPADAALARGDASTSYTDFPRKPEAAQRMVQVAPEIKLVYVVREPIARMRSHYRHRIADGVESRPVDVALLDDRYVRRSCYAMQLEQYMQYFAASQLLVLEAEDLLRGGESWSRLFSFIGVPPLPEPPATPHANEAETRLGLTPGTRALRTRMKDSPVYRLTPHRVRVAARRMGARTRTDNDTADITPTLRAEIGARLRDDMDRFGELTGIRFSAS